MLFFRSCQNPYSVLNDRILLYIAFNKTKNNRKTLFLMLIHVGLANRLLKLFLLFEKKDLRAIRRFAKKVLGMMFHGIIGKRRRFFHGALRSHGHIAFIGRM